MSIAATALREMNPALYLVSEFARPAGVARRAAVSVESTQNP